MGKERFLSLLADGDFAMAATFRQEYIDLLKHYYYVGGMPDMETYYWTNERNTSEIDFLLDTGRAIVPLEVKAEVNLQSKSLKAFADKYHPNLSVRSSMSDYKREDWLLNLPLYAIGCISACI